MADLTNMIPLPGRLARLATKSQVYSSTPAVPAGIMSHEQEAVLHLDLIAGVE